MNKPPMSIPVCLAWSALCACLPAITFYEVYTIFVGEVSHSATRIMPMLWLMYCGIVIFVISILAWLIHPAIGRVVFVFIAAFSLWSLKISFSSDFVATAWVNKLFFLFAIAIALFFVVRRLSREGLRGPLGLGGFLLLAFVALPKLSGEMVDHGGEVFSLEEQHSTTEAPGSSSDDLKIYGDIQLKNKPNIYVLLYDSLIPPEVADLFFGPGSAGYASVLQNSFVRPNGVTAQNAVPSKASISSVMWLDSRGASWTNRYDYFNGKQDSPLAHLFRANGYEVVTGFTTMYWGEETGSYINDFLHLTSAPTQLEQTTLCLDSGKSFPEVLRAFGVCSMLGPFAAMPSLETIVERFRTDPEVAGKPNEAWQRVVENRVRLSAESPMPQFTFLYTFIPIGHTKHSYDHSHPSDRAEYVAHFRERSGLAGLVIEDLVRVVREADNDAVVIVAGDHGTYISRQSKDEGFQVVDRNLVAIALMKTENSCVKDHERTGFVANDRGYHTISSTMLSLISCLADDASIPSRFRPRIIRAFPEKGVSLQTFISDNINTQQRSTFPTR